MAEKEYIEREAVNDLIKAECSPKVAAYLIDAVATIPAADVIEELMRYVQQMEKLRQEGWYLQKTKMMTYGQATMTMPLPEPTKEE